MKLSKLATLALLTGVFSSFSPLKGMDQGPNAAEKKESSEENIVLKKYLIKSILEHKQAQGRFTQEKLQTCSLEELKSIFESLEAEHKQPQKGKKTPQKNNNRRKSLEKANETLQEIGLPQKTRRADLAKMLKAALEHQANNAGKRIHTDNEDTGNNGGGAPRQSQDVDIEPSNRRKDLNNQQQQVQNANQEPSGQNNQPQNQQHIQEPIILPADPAQGNNNNVSEVRRFPTFSSIAHTTLSASWTNTAIGLLTFYTLIVQAVHRFYENLPQRQRSHIATAVFIVCLLEIVAKLGYQGYNAIKK